MPSFSRKSRRSFDAPPPLGGSSRGPWGWWRVRCLPWTSYAPPATRAPGTSRSVIVNRSIVIASVGQRMAHSPHRMHRSSSLTIAESGRPSPSSCAASVARSASPSSSVVERDDGEAVLGADVHAAVAEDARLGVVDRLDVAHQTARRLDARRLGPVPGLHLGDAGAPADVERRRRLAVPRLEAGDHPVVRGRELLDLDRRPRGAPRAATRYSWIERAARLPLATASMRLRGPNATSPPAKTPGAEVASVRRVHLDRAAGRQRDPVLGGEEREVRLLPDREDARVGVDRHDVGVVVVRREAAVVVEDREHLAQLDGAQPPVAHEALRSAPREEARRPPSAPLRTPRAPASSAGPASRRRSRARRS